MLSSSKLKEGIWITWAQGALSRSRFQSAVEMDGSTKFFFGLEKKNGQNRLIHYSLLLDIRLYTNRMAQKWSLKKLEKELYSLILSYTGVKIQKIQTGSRSRFQHRRCMLLCRAWIAVRLVESMVYQLSFIKRFGQCWGESCCLCSMIVWPEGCFLWAAGGQSLPCYPKKVT